MRIGFQIFQCPVSDSIRNATYNIILTDIRDKYANRFKFSYCPIILSEMLGSCLIRAISPQNILFFFCKRFETGLSFLEEEIMANMMRNENNKINKKTRNRQDKNKTGNRAIIVMQCFREDIFCNFRGNKENNKTCNGESSQMTWGQFKEAQKGFDIFNCSHNFKLTQNSLMPAM